jgi:hypothetical protein
MAYRETCDDCMRRKFEDEQARELLVCKNGQALSFSLLHNAKLWMKGLSLAPLWRICMLLGILGGFAASASIHSIVSHDTAIIVWIIQAFVLYGSVGSAKILCERVGTRCNSRARALALTRMDSYGRVRRIISYAVMYDRLPLVCVYAIFTSLPYVFLLACWLTRDKK